MSSKSKYNRRNNFPNKTQGNVTSTEAQAVQSAGISPKPNTTINTSSRAIFDMSAALDNFKSEIKYIGLVAFILIAFLIASYFIFH
jgi:hypothetical protein